MKITAPPGVLTEDCFVVFAGGRSVSVRFSNSVALAEAAQKNGKVYPAKLLYKVSDATPPQSPPPDPGVAEDTASQF